MTWVVPSLQGLFSLKTSSESESHLSRWLARGGLRMYLHNSSSLCRWSALTRRAACREKPRAAKQSDPVR